MINIIVLNSCKYKHKDIHTMTFPLLTTAFKVIRSENCAHLINNIMLQVTWNED